MNIELRVSELDQNKDIFFTVNEKLLAQWPVAVQLSTDTLGELFRNALLTVLEENKTKE